MDYKEWIGKKVVIYEPYANNVHESIKEDVVTKVGSKYIFVGRYKFEMDLLTCPDMNCRLYLGDETQFRQALILKKNIRDFLTLIQKEVVLDMPVERMKTINDTLKQLINQKKNE